MADVLSYRHVKHPEGGNDSDVRVRVVTTRPHERAPSFSPTRESRSQTDGRVQLGWLAHTTWFTRQRRCPSRAGRPTRHQQVRQVQLRMEILKASRMAVVRETTPAKNSRRIWALNPLHYSTYRSSSSQPATASTWNVGTIVMSAGAIGVLPATQIPLCIWQESFGCVCGEAARVCVVRKKMAA